MKKMQKGSDHAKVRFVAKLVKNGVIRMENGIVRVNSEKMLQFLKSKENRVEHIG